MADLHATIKENLDKLRGGPDPEVDEIDNDFTPPDIDEEGGEELEVTDDPDPEVVVETVVPSVAEKVVPPVVDPKAPVVDPEDFSKVPERDAQGRVNRIPHPRVKAMVAKEVKRAQAAWEPERTALTQKTAIYEERLQGIKKTEDMMFEGDEVAFLKLLTGIKGRRFAELLAPIINGTAAPAKAGAVVPTDEPQPDVLDDKGQAVGYSRERLNELRAWDRSEAAKAAQAAAIAAVEKEYGPIKTAWGAHERSVKTTQSIADELANASKRPGFVENAEDILAEMKASPKASLDECWAAVISRKSADAEKRGREAALKELQEAPVSTGLTPSGTKAAPSKVGIKEKMKAILDAKRRRGGGDDE